MALSPKHPQVKHALKRTLSPLTPTPNPVSGPPVWGCGVLMHQTRNAGMRCDGLGFIGLRVPGKPETQIPVPQCYDDFDVPALHPPEIGSCDDHNMTTKGPN